MLGSYNTGVGRSVVKRNIVQNRGLENGTKLICRGMRRGKKENSTPVLRRRAATKVTRRRSFKIVPLKQPCDDFHAHVNEEKIHRFLRNRKTDWTVTVSSFN